MATTEELLKDYEKWLKRQSRYSGYGIYDSALYGGYGIYDTSRTETAANTANTAAAEDEFIDRNPNDEDGFTEEEGILLGIFTASGFFGD